MVFFVVLVAFLGIAAFIATAMLGVSIGSGAGVERYKVSCDGTIDVPAVATSFTKPTIKENSCSRDPCNALGFSIFGDPFAQEGNIELLVDGVVYDRASWSSSFGSDQEYELSTSCLPNPRVAVVKVRDDSGTVTGSKEEVFS